MLGPKYGIQPLKGAALETLLHHADPQWPTRGFLTVKPCPDSQGEECLVSNIIPLAALCQLLCKREGVFPRARVMHEHASYFSSCDRLDTETRRTLSFGSSRRIQSRHLKMLVWGRLNWVNVFVIFLFSKHFHICYCILAHNNLWNQWKVSLFDREKRSLWSIKCLSQGHSWLAETVPEPSTLAVD